ncbi:MAG: RluA family pseudouridine synthase [Clostridia bacterium]|nr:RluA family pseudouridine synthase [Clostridia bacterium]
MLFRVTSELDGASVLYVLRHELGLSSKMIKHLKFLEDGITVGGKRVTVRHALREGDELLLNTEERECESRILPVDLPLRIAYEDEELIIPDKPAFMPTHPSHDHYEDTLANALAFRHSGERFVFRPVNRLDRNTSGLLIIAKNRISAAKLTKSMQERGFSKKYVAILDGAIPKDCGVIDTYMRRTAESIIVREVCDACEGADRAITRYRVILRSPTHTMVMAEPITGRTHQIRVHFAHLGAPLVGDDLYGRESEDIKRHALHSASLSLPHPNSGEEISVRAPLPVDMRALAEKLFPKEDIDGEIEKALAN